MAAPTVRARSSSQQTSNTTTHTITLPTGRVAGDLLVVAVVTDGDPTLTATSGWTRVYYDIGLGDGRMAVYARVASGGSDTLTVTTSANEQSRHLAWALTTGTHGVTDPAVDILVGASGKGDSTSANAPALTIPATADFLALNLYTGNSSTSSYPIPSAAPSGWSQYRSNSSGTGSTGTGVAAAELEVSGDTSVDPPAVTVPNGEWLAMVLAIPSTPLGPVTHDAAGTVAAVSAVTGAVTLVTSAAGTVVAVSSVSGTVAKASRASGTVVASSAVSGAAVRFSPASGTVTAVSTVSGDVTVIPGLFAGGTVSASSTVTGAVTKRTSVAGSVTSTSTVTGSVTKTTAVAGTVTVISGVTGVARMRHQVSGIVAVYSAVFGALKMIEAPPVPPTILLRPTSLVEAGSVVLENVGGDITLDALRVPYASTTIRAALTDPDDIEALDPREDVRVTVTAGDDEAGTSREFDLSLRARTVDHKAKTISLDLASDEALLMDYAPIVRDVGAFTHQSSLRAVINYTLGKIGASLAPGTDDADVTTYTDATNLITDPGTAATGGGGYGVGNANADWNDTTWSISGDGDSYNIYNPTNVDSYMSVAGATGTLFPGLTPGKTYVLSATGNVKAAFTGTDLGPDLADGNGGSLLRTRALVVHTRVGANPYAQFHSAQVPNVVNTPTRVSVEFTVPAGATEVFFRAYLGNTAGQIRWDGFRLSEKDPRPGADNTDYFDGDTLDTAAYAYEWTGTQDISTSRRTALIGRAPELLIWEPGVSAWDFLAPITSVAGLRLFCDEQRVWRLIDPATYTLPGLLSVAGHNATEGSDTIDRRESNAYCTGVVVRYRWRDADGQQEAYDSAGLPGRVLIWEYDRPYPGPGAAAAILARRQGAGRVQDVTALADWTATPGMEARISLPSTIDQQGSLSSVTWSLDDGLMRAGTSNLLDAPPDSWLGWDPDQRWQDVPNNTDNEWRDY